MLLKSRMPVIGVEALFTADVGEVIDDLLRDVGEIGEVGEVDNDESLSSASS